MTFHSFSLSLTNLRLWSSRQFITGSSSQVFNCFCFERKKKSQRDPHLTNKKRFQCPPRGGQHKRHQKKTLQILWLTISSNHFRKITKIFLVTETAIIVSSRNEAEVLDSLKGESNALQSFKEMPADVTSHSLHASKSTSKNGKTFFKNIFKRLYQWRRSPA